MNKKKIGLAALALALCIGVTLGANFIISNVIHQTANVSKAPNIIITVDGFPTDIELGRDYTFAVTTESLADEELTGLVTWITIQFHDGDGDPKELESSFFYIYYNDITTPWEGEISGTFTWDETRDALVSTAMGSGTWDAPVGYYNEATVTCRINAGAPLDYGTLTWEAWVEAPELPLP